MYHLLSFLKLTTVCWLVTLFGISSVNSLIFILHYQGDANNDNWLRVEIPLDSAQKFSIEFVATLGSGEKGDIVLDDISFSHRCSIGGRPID